MGIPLFISRLDLLYKMVKNVGSTKVDANLVRLKAGFVFGRFGTGFLFALVFRAVYGQNMLIQMIWTHRSSIHG